MKKLSIALIASATMLAACGDRYSDPAPMPLDPISQQLVGKKLTSTGMVLQLQEFNKMAGRAGPNAWNGESNWQTGSLWRRSY